MDTYYISAIKTQTGNDSLAGIAFLKTDSEQVLSKSHVIDMIQRKQAVFQVKTKTGHSKLVVRKSPTRPLLVLEDQNDLLELPRF